jgi:hypothetical protein
VEVSVDVSKTALNVSSSGAEQAVRAAIETAFSLNPALLNTLFYSATLAACSAQGIPSNSCPNPPSQVLSLSTPASSPPPQRAAVGDVIVAAVASALGGAVFATAVLGVLWWRAKSSRVKVAPDPETPGLVIRQLDRSHPSAP